MIFSCIFCSDLIKKPMDSLSTKAKKAKIIQKNTLLGGKFVNPLELIKSVPYITEDDEPYHFDKEKSFISYVTVDLAKYLEMNQLVKKTINIPKWADKKAKIWDLTFPKP